MNCEIMIKYFHKFLLRFHRAVGATIVNRPEEIKEEDLGKGCGLFEVQKIGDE